MPDNNEPDFGMNYGFYDENSDSNIKFAQGAENEEGGNLVENPSDALNGEDSADVEGPGPDHVLFTEDPDNENDLNDHVNATVEYPMGNVDTGEDDSSSEDEGESKKE